MSKKKESPPHMLAHRNSFSLFHRLELKGPILDQLGEYHEIRA
ncbi:hypothetical protein CCACVL1_05425 [Corchorus capsularis]|uniref:Uncharacterized protein n=1 Tax=Corchorus capsularis TaxID=210143 RepID=A0A1R3JKH3_COCAP|nr:hypothetical protein CCACVL1_05425 [Corchorus capsularis]